jgi:hypothetical protein
MSNGIEVKKKGKFSKRVSIGIVILLVVTGIVGSFENSFISMERFKEFLIPFSPFFITYMTIVGAGRATKNVAEMKYTANGTTAEVVGQPGGI